MPNHAYPQPVTVTGPPAVHKGPRGQQTAFNNTAVQYGPPPGAPILHHSGHSPTPPAPWQQQQTKATPPQGYSGGDRPSGPAPGVGRGVAPPRDPTHERLMKKAKNRQQQQQQSLQQSSSSQHSTPSTSPAKRGGGGGVKGERDRERDNPSDRVMVKLVCFFCAICCCSN
jgi:hypothetical protein